MPKLHGNIKAIVAGDATTPATWLATLDAPQLAMKTTHDGVEIHPTGTAFTAYVAEEDQDGTWRYLAVASVAAFAPAYVPVRTYRGLAFGVAGGATINVTPFASGGVLDGLAGPAENLGNVGIVNTSEAAINPSTEDTLTTLATATGNLDYVVSAAYTASITASAVIPTAFTASLPANTVRIILIPRGDLYYKIGDTASAATQKLTSTLALNIPATKTLADTIQVFADTVVCDLLVCTPR